MNTTIQMTAHRGHPIARTKAARWQPYSSLTTNPRSPAIMHLNTPQKPSTSPPHPPLSVTPIPCKPQPQPPPPQPTATPISSKESQPREKQKYALTLIDQAVKTLSDIWKPHEIPSVFLGPPSKPAQACPSWPLADGTSNPQSQPQQMLVSTGCDTDCPLLPLKNFVHEVLKRSRTSGSILQTALCYLEAARCKIPEIRRDDHLGITSYLLPDSAIQPATEAEIQMDKDLSAVEFTRSFSPPDDLVKTVQLSDDMMHTELDCEDSSSMLAEPALSTIFATSSSLPSPLLCPRRTFLAALILASKFSQDKCYSNRAWAKLSGLPPREIGRCERALGQALDWRLWVGKSISSQQSASATLSQGRTVVRSQSEGSIASPSSSKAPFLCQAEASTSAPQPPPAASASKGGPQPGRGLRRCSTLPSEPPLAPGQLPTSSARVTPSCAISAPMGLPDRMDIAENLLHSQPIRKPSRKSTILGQYPASAWPTIVGQYECPSSSSSESGSSPATPPLSNTPSSAGDRTIRIAQYEDGTFTPMSTSQLWLDGSFGPVRTASPASFLEEPKKNPAAHMYLASQFALNVAQTLSSVSERPSGNFDIHSGRGPYLWHADGGYATEPARVY